MKHRLSPILLLATATTIVGIRDAGAQATNAPTAGEAPVKLPELTVTGAMPDEPRSGWLQEEQYVGPYNQPEWTTERRFPGTRVYLQQMPWDLGVEQWVRYQHFRDGSAQTRFQEEFEIGLPHRFQLDLYETWAVDEHHRSQQDEVSAELRYALADWGKIPLNPTLYLEYAQHDHDANTLEGKILLGTDFTPRLHWGLNFACEQQLGQPNNTELGVSQGLSYTLLDNKLGAGVEMEYYHEKATGSAPQNQFLIGPSVQWRPVSWCHVDLAPMFGCTHDSPQIEAFLVIGFDFDTGKHKAEHYAPASLRGQ